MIEIVLHMAGFIVIMTVFVALAIMLGLAVGEVLDFLFS